VTEKSSNSITHQLIWGTIVVAVSVLLLVLLVFTAQDKQPKQQSVAAVQVDSLLLTLQDLHPQIQVTGRLQPAKRAALRFELSGQLAERLIEPGQKVEQGQTLLKLQDGDLRDALIEAESRLAMEIAAAARDKRMLEIAGKDMQIQQREVSRLIDLDAKSLVSASALDQARQRLLQLQSSEAQLLYSADTAKSRLRTSRAALDRTKRNLRRATLKAPFAGTVNTVAIEPGDYVTPQSVALELVDLLNIDVYAEVSGPTAAVLTLGQQVDILVGAEPRQGKIIALRSDPDPSTFTHALRIRVDGNGLLAGKLANMRLPLQVQSSVVVVPVTSVLQEDGLNYVFIIENGILQRRKIKAGIRYLNKMVILSGARAGDQIVIRDVAALTDGQAVDVRQPQ